MIRIAIERASDRTIHSFTMSGHARFDQHGRDIVCAGASVVAFGTLNAIEALLGVQLLTETNEKKGYLKAVLPEGLPADTHDRVQLLLEAMLVSLKSIEQSYGKHIRIQD